MTSEVLNHYACKTCGALPEDGESFVTEFLCMKCHTENGRRKTLVDIAGQTIFKMVENATVDVNHDQLVAKAWRIATAHEKRIYELSQQRYKHDTRNN